MSAGSGVEERRVEFKNSRGDKLVGYLVSTSTPRTVILCHGYSDHKDTRINMRLVDRLKSIPLASFRFDFSGNGESEGEFEFGNYWKEVEDIRSAVEYLREQGLEVHGLIGHSKGGNDVMLYASRYDDIPFVVNLSGRFHMKSGISTRFGEDIFEKLEQNGEVEVTRKLPDKTMTTFKLTKKSIEERLSIDMGENSKKIKKSNVLTVHGKKDQTIPYQDAEAFDAVVPKHDLHLLEDADHNFRREEDLDSIVEIAVRFLAPPQ